jgi:hypothetical protein
VDPRRKDLALCNFRVFADPRRQKNNCNIYRFWEEKK